jgi:restriction system protein
LTAKRSKKQERQVRGLVGLAVQLLLMGTALLAAPWLLRHTAIASGLGFLRPLGAVLIVGAALAFALAWWARRRALAAAGKAADTSAMPAPRREQVAMSPKATPTAAAAPALDAQPWSSAVFDAIEWRRFEAVVEKLFQQAGFETRSQPHGADGGVDIWLHSRAVPGQAVSLVQCKHWQGRRVGVDKIRELRGVMAAQGVKRGQFATTSTFTPDAIAFARDNGVNLLDVDALLALIAQRTPEQQAELLAVAYEGDYARPTCASCGSKLVERTAKQGGGSFWGCPGFPACRTTMAIRGA